MKILLDECVTKSPPQQTYEQGNAIEHIIDSSKNNRTMISTDKEFQEEAQKFFETEWSSFNDNHPFDVSSLALKYVKRSSEFKYKDHVDAGVLVTCLVNSGYLEFTERKNNIRYHSLTLKGLDFIKQKRSQE